MSIAIHLRSANICQDRHGAHPTSRAAYEAVAPRKEIIIASILDYLASVPDDTCDESEAALDLSHQRCSARFGELKRDRPHRTHRERRLTRLNLAAAAFRLPPAN